MKIEYNLQRINNTSLQYPSQLTLEIQTAINEPNRVVVSNTYSEKQSQEFQQEAKSTDKLRDHVKLAEYETPPSSWASENSDDYTRQFDLIADRLKKEGNDWYRPGHLQQA